MNSSEIKSVWKPELDRLVGLMSENNATLKLTYTDNHQNTPLAKLRLRNVKNYIFNSLEKYSGGISPIIEEKIISKGRKNN